MEKKKKGLILGAALLATALLIALVLYPVRMSHRERYPSTDAMRDALQGAWVYQDEYRLFQWRIEGDYAYFTAAGSRNEVIPWRITWQPSKGTFVLTDTGQTFTIRKGGEALVFQRSVYFRSDP